MSVLMRLSAWLLPPHRQDWAEAMINELDAIGSRRAAIGWILGCVCTALRERVIFEITGSYPMRRKIFRLSIALAAMLILGIAGVIIGSKPYQRERLRIEMCRMITTSAERCVGR